MTSEKRHTVRRTARPAERSARLPKAAPVQLELEDARVRQLWRRVNEEASRQDQRAAEDAHDQGTLLLELASLSVDASEDEVAAEFLLGPAEAKERMAIARGATRLMAGFYGLERIRLGLQILPFFSLQRLEQLETVVLPVRTSDDAPVRFPATREQLERALEVLRAGAR